MRLKLILSVMLVVGGHSISLANVLDCPSGAPASVAGQSNEIATLAATSNLVERAPIVRRIVSTLRDRGMVPVGIVDSLVPGYCSAIAANTSLSTQQKIANVRAFAAQVVRAAYGFENAEEIILDVALPPAVVSVINQKAKESRMTAEEWAATAVINAAKPQR